MTTAIAARMMGDIIGFSIRDSHDLLNGRKLRRRAARSVRRTLKLNAVQQAQEDLAIIQEDNRKRFAVMEYNLLVLDIEQEDRNPGRRFWDHDRFDLANAAWNAGLKDSPQYAADKDKLFGPSCRTCGERGTCTGERCTEYHFRFDDDE